MSEALMRVVYVSHNTIEGDDDELALQIEQILDTARSRNREVGITGALMFNRGLFAQILEGPTAAVEETFERIQCDLRHADVVMVACEAVAKRSFDQWSMAYVGSREKIPTVLLDIADTTGFDARKIDADAVNDAIRTMLVDE